MRKNKNYIPKEFLKNNSDFYITSTIKKNIEPKKTDKIWLILSFLIILDVL